MKIAAVGILAVSAQAGTISGFVSRSVFGGDDTVSWGSAADEGTTPSSPYARLSAGGGLTATATLSTGFRILVEGSLAAGNFNPGDVLLSTNSVNGPIVISFSSPIQGAGLQFQRNNSGAFGAVVRSYGAGNMLFSTFQNNAGNSNGSQNNSAIFAGVKSSLTDITRIEVEVFNGFGSPDDSFLVNFLSISGTPNTAIPEPRTLGLVGLALSVILWKHVRKLA